MLIRDVTDRSFAEYGKVLGGIIFLSVVVILLMTIFDRIQRRVLYWTNKR